MATSPTGIIDYGMGNLRSVQKALEAVGADAVILKSPDQTDQVERLILPGVGAFADGMEHLRQRGWPDAIHTFIASGRPFLGICLGLQLLFDGSEEDAPNRDQLVPGLGVLPGKVVRFENEVDGQRIKVPHMGWNDIRWVRDNPLMTEVEQESYVYFVHSYYAVPDETEAFPLTATLTDYPEGRPFCSSVMRGNVWAMQFHPEKSQRVGLTILKNFAHL